MAPRVRHTFSAILVLAVVCVSCAPLPDRVPIESSCTATDGDTIQCGKERIRLLGIHAPELPDQCRPDRWCPPGDPFASLASLSAAMKDQPLSIIRLGEDRYGRTLGLVQAGERDLSCYQVATGHAFYVGGLDGRNAVSRTCPEVVG